jgi:hypothetical protein
MDRAHVACDKIVWDMYTFVLLDEPGDHTSTAATGSIERHNTFNATMS